MKRIKLVLLCLLVIFVSGCTATYDLNITSSSFEESVTLNMNSKEYFEFMSDDNNSYVKMYYDDPNDVGSDGVDLPIEGVKYYDFISDDVANNVKFSGKFDYDEFNRSSLIRYGFNSTKLSFNSDEMHIKTSTGFTFLYDELKSLKVRVTSPYKVMYSNADSVDGNTLIWNITKSNASKKFIAIDYSLNNKSSDNDVSDNNEIDNNIPQVDEPDYDVDLDTDIEQNNSSSILIIVGIVIGIILFGGLIVLIIKKNQIDKL